MIVHDRRNVRDRRVAGAFRPLPRRLSDERVSSEGHAVRPDRQSQSLRDVLDVGGVRADRGRRFPPVCLSLCVATMTSCLTVPSTFSDEHICLRCSMRAESRRHRPSTSHIQAHAVPSIGSSSASAARQACAPCCPFRRGRVGYEPGAARCLAVPDLDEIAGTAATFMPAATAVFDVLQVQHRFVG